MRTWPLSNGVLKQTAARSVQKVMFLNAAMSQHLHFGPNTLKTLLFSNSNDDTIPPAQVYCTNYSGVLVDCSLSSST